MRAAALLLLALCCFAASVSANDVFTTTGSFYNNSACTTNQMPYSLTYNSITDGTGNSTSACVQVGDRYYTGTCLPYHFGGLSIDGMYSIYEYSDATCKTMTLRSAIAFSLKSFPSGCVSMAGFTADTKLYTVVDSCTYVSTTIPGGTTPDAGTVRLESYSDDKCSTALGDPTTGLSQGCAINPWSGNRNNITCNGAGAWSISAYGSAPTCTGTSTTTSSGTSSSSCSPVVKADGSTVGYMKLLCTGTPTPTPDPTPAPTPGTTPGTIGSSGVRLETYADDQCSAPLGDPTTGLSQGCAINSYSGNSNYITCNDAGAWSISAYGSTSNSTCTGTPTTTASGTSSNSCSPVKKNGSIVGYMKLICNSAALARPSILLLVLAFLALQMKKML